MGGMPPPGESACAGAAARATIAPKLLREVDMEEKVGEEGKYQTLWPKVYVWNVQVNAAYTK